MDTETVMAEIMENVKHIVVVMFENRSLDTFLGWLYPDGERPKCVLPAGSSPHFDGVTDEMSNPLRSGERIFVTRSTANVRVPDPDPQETLVNVHEQIFGSKDGTTPSPSPMQGFVRNYQTTSTHDPSQVMQCHSAEQLPVLFALARAYAVSDAWFASVPSQTWPNRAFAHAGTSNGHINNGRLPADHPDPFQWDVRTIFNVLEDAGTPWTVYHDTTVVPSLTRTMFPKLWEESLSPRFKSFSRFVDACASGLLPRYSFIEPSFLIEPTDQHPPHDVAAGDHFLYRIWKAISTSPAWHDTLLIITFDEHGGNFDHVQPPGNAVPPDATSMTGDDGFRFDRFGVRVPAVLVSPRIAPGTVFRSPTDTPYDHTSILATLRDWLHIPEDRMLPSARIAKAPTIAQVLTLDVPRDDVPEIAEPSGNFMHLSLGESLNDLQTSLVAGNACRFGLNPHQVLASMRTRAHAVEFLSRVVSHGSPDATE
jgi:phospholipase C